jgi:hypothetical protein
MSHIATLEQQLALGEMALSRKAGDALEFGVGQFAKQWNLA